MKKVMCFGTFDLLHVGHLDYFKQARKYGDHLIVVIARDVTKEKQHKEGTFSEEERRELVSSLRIVDEAILGYAEDHFKVILEQKPDAICLGYDHPITEEKLQEKLQEKLAGLRLHPEIYRMKPYKEEKHKSSKLKALFLKTI